MKAKKPYSQPKFEKRQRLSDVTQNPFAITGGGSD